MLPVVAGTLMLVGVVVALSALGARSNKAAFVGLLTLGTAMLLAGVGLLLTPDAPAPAVLLPSMPLLLPSILKTSTNPKRNRKRKLAPRGKGLTEATRGTSLAADASLTGVLTVPALGGASLEGAVGMAPSPAVSWSDDTGLEKVVQFEKDDAPAAILAAIPLSQPAHKPKSVPMRLPAAAANAASLPEYVPAVAGYMAASAPGCNLADTFNPPPIAPSVGGAVYYKPPSKYPTVGEIAEERSRFWSKPETPEIDRHRRLGQLRDYALTMRPQRSGTMVPLTVA